MTDSAATRASVSDAEQLRRFKARRNDPVRQWKLSPMDLESGVSVGGLFAQRTMVHTDTPSAPGVVESETKARG